jgi:glyoxylase-like metal-dependent hydrolase (beta-lactamase superfamily II)
MASNTVVVGNVELIALVDGLSERDPLDIFPGSTAAQWDEYSELLDENRHIHPRFGTTGVRSAGKLIIVDTGMQLPGATLINDMLSNGIRPEDVDLVVFTHLHPDHVGWNISDGKPTFPNARYLAPRTDWNYWTQPEILRDAIHVQEQVIPLQELNLLDLMDDDHTITDEIRTFPTPGHTPGHTSIEIQSAGEIALILGDVIHSPAQAHYTNWNPVFDVLQDISRETRNRILDKIEHESTLVSAGHFPHPGFGRFIRIKGRRLWQGI